MTRMRSPADALTWLSPDEVATLLNLHVMTIYAMLRTKQLPATKIGGKWRVHRDRLETYLFKRMGI